MNAAQRLARLRSLLAGRFRIDAHLGSGGYADVYRVTNLHLDRPEALKVLTAYQPDDPVFIDRFLHESKLAASLVHPGIVRVYDSGDAEGVLWFSMELVEGRTLAAELEDRGPLPERRVAEVAVALLDALAYSHGRGVVHRDVKPDNVLLDARGAPHLMDFGIAKSPRSLLKTQTGFVVGTPAYIAPEQARGLPIDGRADVYALSVVLFHLASGRFPFEAEDPLQAVVLRLTDEPAPLSRVRPGVDPVFEAIVMKGLARAAEERWGSAVEMKDALERFLRGEAPAGLPAAAPRAAPSATHVLPMAPEDVAARTAARAAAPPPGRPGRRRALFGAAAVAAVAAAVGGVVLLRQGPPADHGETASPASALRSPAPAAATPTSLPEPTPVPPTPTIVVRPPRPAPTAVPVPPARRAVVAPRRVPGEDGVPAGLPESCLGVNLQVSFAVTADGSVAEPAYLSRSHPECERFAVEAARAWRFTPARDAQGEPVPSARQGGVVLFGAPGI